MSKYSRKLNESLHILALSLTPGVGSVTCRHLISYCGGPQNVFSTDLKKLLKVPGVGEKLARSIRSGESMALAEQQLASCRQQGVELIDYLHPAYPQRLKSLFDAPVLLYTKGVPSFNHKRVVGIVGTRGITDYGRAVTETIIKELIPYSPLVVSGLAYGVDIVAHRACLKHQLPTVGVMASGVDIIYPASHARTAAEMLAQGALVSENPLGAKPDFMRFPARNRIIAGMSDVVIVVESAKKGGSLITVEYAQNYHREVYAVPGSLFSEYSAGCNQLIKDNKAAVFTSVEEMAEALGWTTDQEQEGKASSDVLPLHFEGFSPDEAQILATLRKAGDLQIDELSWHTGIYVSKLATLLLNLEFQGMVRSLPGKKYSLC